MVWGVIATVLWMQIPVCESNASRNSMDSAICSAPLAGLSGLRSSARSSARSTLKCTLPALWLLRLSTEPHLSVHTAVCVTYTAVSRRKRLFGGSNVVLHA